MIFGKEIITPLNFKQGQLQDSFFLDALSVLAEEPEQLKSMFITNECNTAGIYLIVLYVNGLLTAVTVDDYLPVDKNKRPIFTGSSNPNELWVTLL